MPELESVVEVLPKQRLIVHTTSELTLTRRLVSKRHGEDHALTRVLTAIIASAETVDLQDPIIVFEDEEFDLVQGVLLDQVFNPDLRYGYHGGLWEQEQARYIMIHNREEIIDAGAS